MYHPIASRSYLVAAHYYRPTHYNTAHRIIGQYYCKIGLVRVGPNSRAV
jgi:hypothetical protein